MAQGSRTNNVRAVLEKHTLAHLQAADIASSPVICFEHTDTVGFVLETFADQEIISAPVLHRQQSAAQATPDDRRYSHVEADDIIGFVDLSVILQSFLRSAFESNVLHHTGEDLEKIGSKFCDVRVGTLLEDGTQASCHAASAFDSALKGEKNCSLLTAIRECFLFCKPGSMRPPKIPSRSIHRVAVYEAPPDSTTPARVCGIVSQSDIVRFLHEHAAAIGGPMHKAVRELGLVGTSSADVPPSPSSTSSECSERLSKPALHPQVITVPHNVTALEAFRRMCMYRVSGVGVLAADGTLGGNLSATDLISLAPGLFHTLLLPVDNFLAQRPLLKSVQDAVHEAVSGAGEAPEDGAAAPPAKRPKTSHVRGVWRLTCQATSTLGEVVALMGCHDVHRIYVVDPDSKPLAAITMSDVLRVLRDHAAPHPAPHAVPAPAAAPRRGRGTPPPDSVTSAVSDVPASVSTSVASDV